MDDFLFQSIQNQRMLFLVRQTGQINDKALGCRKVLFRPRSSYYCHPNLKLPSPDLTLQPPPYTTVVSSMKTDLFHGRNDFGQSDGDL